MQRSPDLTAEHSVVSSCDFFCLSSHRVRKVFHLHYQLHVHVPICSMFKIHAKKKTRRKNVLTHFKMISNKVMKLWLKQILQVCDDSPVLHLILFRILCIFFFLISIPIHLFPKSMPKANSTRDVTR